ncbi:hypothetical protein [Anaerovibrio sp.]|uniref:hypothetical protein n=1 Tax=Anaerovibrio sp. TaxID=1872532 RepID=UPI0038909612
MVSFEDCHDLIEQIHDSLMEIRKLECEMAELDRMLDNVGNKLNSVDRFTIPEILS